MNGKLFKAYKFFHAYAGYCAGRRAIGAIALARAELRARELDLEFTWESDCDCDAESWLDSLTPALRRKWDATDHSAEICYVNHYTVDDKWTTRRRDTLASLSGIIDADDNYRRTVQAGLAIEAIDKLAESENLDCMDIDDLRTIAETSCCDRLALRREYAIWKVRAMECRLSGNLNRALEYESDCDRIYRRLPVEQRW